MRSKVIIFSVLIVTLLVGCAIPISPPSPDRVYTGLNPIDLYPLLEVILIAEGFSIAERNYSRGFIRSNWKEIPGKKHGLITWDRQIRYTAIFEIDRINQKRHLLLLHLQAQEKPPLGSSWKDMDVDSDQEEQYQRILQQLDESVKRSNGILL